MHNGYGGPAAWTKFATFNKAPITTFAVAKAPAWPTTVFDVSQMAGADDDAKVTAALDAAKANGGGVLLFPAGTYTLNQPIFDIPPHVLVKGAAWTPISSSDEP